MKSKIFLNITVNTLLAVIFVSLNIWALNTGLEETFVAIALFYGFVVVAVNALLIAFAKK